MLETIPVVEMEDIKKLDPMAVTTIGTAFHDIGFVFVRVPTVAELLPEIYRKFKNLFDLPEEIKHRYARPDLYHQRGWTPPFTEKGIVCQRLGLPADSKENWFIGPELNTISADLVKNFPEHYIENIWPEEVPDFKPAALQLYHVLYECGREVLRAVANYMAHPLTYFDEMITNSPTVLRPLFYPPVSSEQVGKVMHGCRHTDINFATVLPASTREGLWIRRRGGIWIPGHAPEKCLIVQVGDMLQYLTGGEFLSAWHEVRAPNHPTSEGRLSGALFIHARSDIVFDPGKRGYPRITAGELLLKRLQEIGLA